MSVKLSPEVLKKMSVLKINTERDLYKKLQGLIKSKKDKEALEFITQFVWKWRKPGEFVNYWVDYILQETVYHELYSLAQACLKFEDLDPNVTTVGDGALHVACMYNRLKLVNLLINHPKINLDLQDFGGKTGLHWALLKGHKNVIEVLIRLGANEKVIDSKGNDCLEVSLDSSIRTYALELLDERERKREIMKKKKAIQEKRKKELEERKKKEKEQEEQKK